MPFAGFEPAVSVNKRP